MVLLYDKAYFRGTNVNKLLIRQTNICFVLSCHAGNVAFSCKATKASNVSSCKAAYGWHKGASRLTLQRHD